MVFDILSWFSSLIINAIYSSGYFGIVFLMALESACLPVPSEIIMPFSGYLVLSGKFNFWLVVFFGALGNLTGSLIAYFIGLWGGRPFLEKYGKYILIHRDDLELADKWFVKYGDKTVFFSRLLPVVRTFISFPAGIAKMEIKKFSFYTFAGSFFWSWFLTYIGLKLGERWQEIEIYFRKFDIFIALLFLILIIWFIKKHIKK